MKLGKRAGVPRLSDGRPIPEGEYIAIYQRAKTGEIVVRGLATVGLVSIQALAACSKDEPTPDPDNEQYKLGYQAGQDDEKTELCNQIENYKDSIATALKDQDICPQ
jgi:hypothetical protein